MRFTRMFCAGVATISLIFALAAQTPKQQPAQKRAARPLQAQSSSTIKWDHGRKLLTPNLALSPFM